MAYLEQIDNHVPLAAIADEVVRKVVDKPVIDWQVGMLDRKFEVVVGLVQLVPEEEVVL